MRNGSKRKAERRGGLWGRAAILALLALAALRGTASADPSDNDRDSITISLTPVADLGVDIDTGAVNLNFTLAPGATGYSLSPATVTILGNIQPQELDLSAQNVSASPVWTLDADETAGTDELQLYALFSVARDSQPLEAEFAGTKNLLTTSVKRAGQASGAAPNGNFENNAMTGGADMDNMAVGAKRQLWLRMDAPPLTSTDATQDIQVTITATRSSL